MGYQPEDLALDEGYWESLLKDVEAWSAERPSLESQTEERHRINGYNGASDLSYLGPASDEEDDFLGFSPNTPEVWVGLREAMHHGDALEVEATGSNRGGLIVRYHTLRGFIPASHLMGIAPDMDEAARRKALAGYIGQRINVCVIELDPSRERIVFSERLARNSREEDIPPLLNEIRPGEVRRGRVTNLTAFGAFVDLGGYEGLIHVSEMSWSRVGHPRDVLTIGQEIDVFVLSVDPSQGRIALSLKRTRPDPWIGIEQRYAIGQTVSGHITNVVDFGVFVKVEDDLEGLVHVSELGEGTFLHPRNVFKEGQRLTARVIGVDGEMRRLALSLRNVNT
ncbi:MAG: 30S ribosomal protein S1 [Candidatus Roseilinea sp.]|uniref:30S ribosomal protein S1 n=1 Tax=Candidatus Roseilinea sp. TaxID=2838777 RepID=UPI00404952F8